MKTLWNSCATSLLRKSLRHSTLIVLVLLTGAGALSAQQEVTYDEEAETKFDSALSRFADERWREAATLFQELAVERPPHQRSTASYLMTGRSWLRAGAPTKCLRLLEEFRERFPSSSYMAESCYISAEASREAGAPGRALEYYLRAWKDGFSDRELLRERIARIPGDELTAFDRRVAGNLLAQIPDSASLDELLSWRAGDGTAAHGDGDAAGKMDGGSDVAGDADAAGEHTAEQQEDGATRPVIVAAALPLHMQDPARADIVDDLLVGMRAALHMHHDDDGYPVELRLFDSTMPDTAEAVIAQLERNPRASVLIAGAFSEDARTICEIAGERDLLVLLPTATAEGLTRYGTNIFQLNTPISDRARLLADFCYLELDAQQVFVLSPRDSYPRRMADVFVSRWEEFGLPVRTVQYSPGDTEAISTACRTRLAGGGAKNCILFAPVASKRDIAAVLKGVGSAGGGTVVGGGNWNHPDLLREHGGDLTIYFETDVLPDSSRADLSRLRDYLSRHNEGTLTREMLFGFDAMDLTLRLVGDGPTTRQEARKRIRDIFEGIRAPVNFMQTRVNRAMNVLKCDRGNVSQLDSFFAK